MSKAESSLVTIAEPSSPVSEAFRALRTNIQFAAVGRELHTLLVTSAEPGAGKSSTVANLAVTMAQADQRVILVDCDLRKPALHTLFGLESERGLVTMMLEEEGLEEPYLQETGVPGLSLLAAGPQPPRPSDVLSSKRMERIIEMLRERADILLFDAPPILSVTDASILATKVDGVLLVTKAGYTKREQVEDAKAQLTKVNAHIVGAVLANADVRGQTAYYGNAS
jgi:capsular exopolysaccharide synthesis family protein